MTNFIILTIIRKTKRPIGWYFENAFTERLDLLMVSAAIVGLFVWYFNDKIKKK